VIESWIKVLIDRKNVPGGGTRRWAGEFVGAVRPKCTKKQVNAAMNGYGQEMRSLGHKEVPDAAMQSQ
jgi:hypothetical protein